MRYLVRLEISLVFVAIVCVSSIASAQLLDENFDSHDVGFDMSNHDRWESLWPDGKNGGGLVTDERAYSGKHSLRFTRPLNLLNYFNFQGLVSGNWILSTMQYVPSAASSGDAHYSVLIMYESTNTRPIIRVISDFATGDVRIKSGDTARVPLVRDAWAEIKVEFDFHAQEATFYYNGELLGTRAATRLVALVLYANSNDVVYLDNLWLGTVDMYENRYPEDGVSSVLYVKADAVGADNGTSWADAYSDLQEALAVAAPGNDIWVAAGTYLPSATSARDATFQLKSGVGLYGGFVGTEVLHSERDPATNLTILSGDLNGNDLEVLEPPDLVSESTRSDNSYHVVTGSYADETAVLDGFVITGGNANGSGNTHGGGMINVETVTVPANPTVVNCTFYRNSAAVNGGGIYNELGDPTITDCVFSENHGNGAPLGQGGGGVHNARGSLTLRRCQFQGNTSIGGGAGLYNNNASPTVIDTTFDGNRVTGGGQTNVGGGIFNKASDATIINCTFTGNSAQYGGGIFNGEGPASTIANCIFTGNEGRLGGGGINNWISSPTVTNCSFVANIAVNAGGGLRVNGSGSSGTTVTNCIFWGNVAHSSAQIFGSPEVTYSCVQGGISGEGNIDADPHFIDSQNGDFRLKSQAGRWDPLSKSWKQDDVANGRQDDVINQCIDAGDPMSPIGLEPFPNGGFINMGAYGGTAQASKSYFGQPACDSIVAGDLNGDCQVDHADLEIMALHWTGDPSLAP
jgi:hypothetical protein